MASLFRLANCIGKTTPVIGYSRNISLSPISYLKEIIEKKEGNTLIIEAVLKEDQNEDRLLKSKKGACSICSSGLNIKHTDVLILNQFVRSDGCILPRRITGLCEIQQKRISSMILMAQRAGLMPRPPCIPRRTKWRCLNTYYDENTIKARYNTS